MTPLPGGCYCGAIRYVITLDDPDTQRGRASATAGTASGSRGATTGSRRRSRGARSRSTRRGLYQGPRGGQWKRGRAASRVLRDLWGRAVGVWGK
ncbi:hypothetical protein CIB48_g6694 [Xylaria polymorpha]|nr:hypothetical protein CIB48_g6694 [Xylaria polymorpha]